MKITNEKYKNLNLANEEERGENLIIDFIISSFFGVVIAFLTFKNFTIAFLTYILIRFIYYFTFEYLYGRTPGKYQTQTEVVNGTGEKPNIGQLIKRNISRFISILSGISDDELAVHDNLSNTFVIKNTLLKKIEIKQPLIFIFYLSLIAYYIHFFSTQSELELYDIIFLTAMVILFIYVLIIGIKKIKNYS
ncbi:RDD family protein [Mangrovimonas sp. YM274]|uniref:RDD family protein n=1 Tax=Mangrovimonas sp. YM274 TaxID=3070660 RepID=UPI0027DDCD32|nr:RDD family protein [Mangrovimonas sp. YM274]WMI68259.1 RDD family protein [Mangrovimonas sp. YM274]